MATTETTETTVPTETVAAPEATLTSPEGTPKTLETSVPEAATQEAKETTKAEWDFDRLVSTIATLVKPEPESAKPEANTEAQPEAKPGAEPEPAEANQYRQIEEVLHNVLVTQANVPEVLKPLLPKGISELQEFLNSEPYRQLATALKPTTPSAKPAETDPAPAPQDTPKSSAAPKTAKDLDLSVLAELDQFFL